MALDDIVPILLATRIERRPIGARESKRRWAARNRAKLRAYQREWYRKRKEAA